MLRKWRSVCSAFAQASRGIRVAIAPQLRGELEKVAGRREPFRWGQVVSLRPAGQSASLSRRSYGGNLKKVAGRRQPFRWGLPGFAQASRAIRVAVAPQLRADVKKPPGNFPGGLM